MRWAVLLVFVGCGQPAPHTPAPHTPASTPIAAPSTRMAAPSVEPTSARPAIPSDGMYEGIHFTELTTGGATETDRLPLLIALHGFGDTGESFAHAFSDLPLRARVAAPDGVRALRTGGFSWFPTDGARDPEQRARPMREVVARLEPAITSLAHTRPTCGTPVVTGFSQGAMIAFALGASEAPVIDASFPISGYLPPSLVTREATERPHIVALHGESDHVVSIRFARAAITALERAGYRAELRTYPATDHEISTAMATDLIALLRDAFSGCD